MSKSAMLRTRRRDVNVKPNRRLDRKSSRGMIYENEELRLRTININAEIERGQSDIKKLRKENEQLRKEIWCLRDEYDKLDRLLKEKHDCTSSSDSETCTSCSESEDPETTQNLENVQKTTLNSLRNDFDHLSVVTEETSAENSDKNSQNSTVGAPRDPNWEALPPDMGYPLFGIETPKNTRLINTTQNLHLNGGRMLIPPPGGANQVPLLGGHTRTLPLPSTNNSQCPRHFFSPLKPSKSDDTLGPSENLSHMSGSPFLSHMSGSPFLNHPPQVLTTFTSAPPVLPTLSAPQNILSPLIATPMISYNNLIPLQKTAPDILVQSNPDETSSNSFVNGGNLEELLQDIDNISQDILKISAAQSGAPNRDENEVQIGTQNEVQIETRNEVQIGANKVEIGAHNGAQNGAENGGRNGAENGARIGAPNEAEIGANEVQIGAQNEVQNGARNEVQTGGGRRLPYKSEISVVLMPKQMPLLGFDKYKAIKSSIESLETAPLFSPPLMDPPKFPQTPEIIENSFTPLPEFPAGTLCPISPPIPPHSSQNPFFYGTFDNPDPPEKGGVLPTPETPPIPGKSPPTQKRTRKLSIYFKGNKSKDKMMERSLSLDEKPAEIESPPTRGDSDNQKSSDSKASYDKKHRKSSSTSPERRHVHIQDNKKSHKKRQRKLNRRNSLSIDKFQRDRRSFSVCTDRSNILEHRFGADEFTNSERDRSNSLSSCDTIKSRKTSQIPQLPGGGKIPWFGCWGNGCL